MTVVCHESQFCAAYAASPKLYPARNRSKNAATLGVPIRYGSSTHPRVMVAPLLSSGPTQFFVVERRFCALNECKWYAKAPGMNSTVGWVNGPETSQSYQPA